MKAILQGMVALGAALALTATAPAGYRSAVHHSGHAYHVTYGVHFSHGYYFRGPDWNHFTYRCWSPRYRCFLYWYPGAATWYYWSGPQAVYYPVSYATVVPPGGDAPPGTASLPSDLPPGLTPPG